MARPVVFVTRPVPEEGLQPLLGQVDLIRWEEDRPAPREVLLREAARADGVLSQYHDRWDVEAFDAAPRLRVVSNAAVGYDNVDLAAATARGVFVTNTPDVVTEATADLTFALILSVARRVGEAERFLRGGAWKQWSPLMLLGTDMHGAILGIVGLGRIGQAVARRAQGFGLRVIYHNRQRRQDVEAALGVTYVEFDTLLRESDFVTVHVPMSAETRHLIGARELALMKPSAFLINAARGPVVDQKAVADALRTGQIAGAGLDVYAAEPIDPADPLLGFENCCLLPHIGAATVGTRIRMTSLAAENVLAALQGKVPPSLVNQDVRGRLTPLDRGDIMR